MRTPRLESDPRALMGFANKNDRHATHLSPRELLFNGLHPASVPPPPCGTACGSDVASREYRYTYTFPRLSPRGHTCGTADFINLSRHISDLSEIGCIAENKFEIL